MAKKKGSKAEKQFAESIVESANQVWLAGLSVFAKGEKRSSKLFASMVKDGEKVEAAARKALGEQYDELRQRAGGSLDKIEKVMDERVAQALSALSIPSSKDIQALKDEISRLNNQVNTKAAPKSAVKKAAANPASRPAVKKAAAKPNAKKPATKAKVAPARKVATARKSAPAKATADDLTQIDGLGAAAAGKLKTAGITKFQQIASWTDAEVQRIGQDVIGPRYAGLIDKHSWRAQARDLHAKKYGK